MSGSHYRQQSPRGTADDDEQDPDIPGTAKRRRLNSSSASPRFRSEAEAGPSRQVLAPRRIPSDTPSEGHRAGSGKGDWESERDGSDDGGAGTESLTSSADWTYELVVLQHPQRARACGFGDKDRRPLSPPPILRLYIRTPGGQLVDPSIVPLQFLLLVVDLWSADSTQQRNVVMHPIATTRLASPPPPTTEEPRPATADWPPTSHYPTTGWRWTEHHSPQDITHGSTGPSPHSRIAGTSVIQDHLPVPASPTIPAPRPASSPTSTHFDPLSLRPSSSSGPRPLSAPSDTLRPLRADTTMQRSGSINLPPIASITGSLPRHHPSHIVLSPFQDQHPRPSTGASSYLRPSTTSSDWTRSSFRPSWSTESSRPATDYSFARTSTSTWYTSSISSDGRERDQPQVTGWPPPRSSTFRQSWGTPLGPLSPHLDPLSARSSSWTHPWAGVLAEDGDLARPSSSGRIKPSSSPHPLPSAQSTLPEIAEVDNSAGNPAMGPSFSRVLVGSVCAMCQRLTDEEGDEGLFFFTPDLAVRTEGVFRLKFSLSNLEPLLTGDRTQGEGTAVLSQVYSEPFTVYSAKKFPGVVPTTKLTSLFAAQNIRLPTRQKRGGGGAAEPDGDGEDEEA